MTVNHHAPEPDQVYVVAGQFCEGAVYYAGETYTGQQLADRGLTGPPFSRVLGGPLMRQDDIPPPPPPEPDQDP
jgi:hypothetical protein